MKRFVLMLLVLLVTTCLTAQDRANYNSFSIDTSVLLFQQGELPNDSLRNMLAGAINNETRAIILFQLTTNYMNYSLDSSLKYIRQFNEIPLKSKVWVANGFIIMGDIFYRLGNASMALETILKGSKIAEESNEPATIGMAYWNIGKVYQGLDEYEKAIGYYLRSMKIAAGANKKQPQSYSMGWLGLLYMNLDSLNLALYYTQSAYEIRKQMPENTYTAALLAQLGDIYRRQGDTNLAKAHYRTALELALPKNNFSAAAEACVGMATLFKEANNNDSCNYYARRAFLLAQQVNGAALILKVGDSLKVFFKDQNLVDSAFIYQEIMISKRDSLEKTNRVHDISLAEQQRIREAEIQEKEFRNKIKIYTLIISLAVFLFIALFLYRNNRQKQKVNILLHQQKEEIQCTLTELKTTQAQLIQSEKMASLGELTAGIAHEIQNPLNFVNNFSEVSSEMFDEMKEELVSGNVQLATEIADDIKQNLEKINHHGKRADAIVKGMLQHSKTSTGVKEPTNINKLADEYLRLSYHGMRAKDKSFNAEFKTEFDENIGNVNVVPQDIGRVLLNLFNNAFYAVNERKKNPYPLKGDKEFEPTVSVITKRINSPSGDGGKIEIIVLDNGPGIRQNIIDKIFQPFFTTKPTGQGTGLGLSLAYDIIKAHGGEINVDSKECAGSEFIVQLPIV